MVPESQGTNLAEAEVHLEGICAAGIMFVALSRARTLAGLLIDP